MRAFIYTTGSSWCNLSYLPRVHLSIGRFGCKTKVAFVPIAPPVRGVVGQTAGLRVVLKHGSDLNSRESGHCVFIWGTLQVPRDLIEKGSTARSEASPCLASYIKHVFLASGVLPGALPVNKTVL